MDQLAAAIRDERVDFEDLSTDRLNEAACYVAAGEAARRTRHPIALHEDGRR
ncbi:hypothetical protein AB0425_08545 [Actinosynnema sp. NPDC051121]